jgi:hypothetical protein
MDCMSADRSGRYEFGKQSSTARARRRIEPRPAGWRWKRKENKVRRGARNKKAYRRGCCATHRDRCTRPHCLPGSPQVASNTAAMSTVVGTDTANLSRAALRPAPASLTTLQEILSAISSLESEEAVVSVTLAELLSAREPIIASLDRLQTLGPQLDELRIDASALSEKVSATARTADRVGGRVKTLDEEMRRVRDATERVGQVMELKVRAFTFSRWRTRS